MLCLEPIPPETEQVARELIRCAIAVHRELGPGFLEHIYRRALCLELKASGLTHETEKQITVSYRGHTVGVQRLDIVVEGKVLVELKAVAALDYVHKAQALSYLRASGLRLGLLINFNVALLKDGIRRIVL